MNALFIVSAIFNIVLGTNLVAAKRPRTATVDEVAQMRERLYRGL